ARGSSGRDRRARRVAKGRTRSRRLRRGRPTPSRDRGRGVGGTRRRRGARVPARPEAVTTEQVYGRRPVREALRGPREVVELWASERALKSESWLRGEIELRLKVKPERDLTAAAGTQDHQGVLGW